MSDILSIDTSLLTEAQEAVPVTFLDGDGQLTNFSIPTVVYNNPYAFDISSFIPQTQVFNLDRFFSLSKQIFDDFATRTKVPVVPLVEEYPPLDMASIGQELVTFRLISRQPANLSTDARSRPQRSFKNSYSYKDKNYGDNVIEVMNRPLDHEIEFTVWATSNKLANKRVIWLENLLLTQTWVYKSQGADRFHFIKRLQDGYLTTGQQRIFYRPLRFFLRFNEFLIKANYQIKNMELELGLTTET